MITLFISFFMFMTLVCALQVITRKNPVHSVLWLIFLFFNSCAIMIMLHAEYIAMITIIVYVGAVVILFLFVVMFLDIDITSNKKKISLIFPLVFITALAFVGAIYYALNNSPYATENFNTSQVTFDATYLIAHNLYTQYLLEFQISALILLLAMIGTITLIFQKKHRSVKRQIVNKQLMRNKQNSIELIDAKNNKGVKI